MVVLVRVQIHVAVRLKSAIFHRVPLVTKTAVAVALKHVPVLRLFSVVTRQLARHLPLLPAALLQVMEVPVVQAVSVAVVALAVAVGAEVVSAVEAVLAEVVAAADNAIVSFLFFVYL